VCFRYKNETIDPWYEYTHRLVKLEKSPGMNTALVISFLILATFHVDVDGQQLKITAK